MANEEVYSFDIEINVDDNTDNDLNNVERRLNRVQKLIQKMNRTRVNINSALKDKVTQKVERMQRVIQSINRRGIILTARDMASNTLNRTKEKITNIIQKAKSFGSATYQGVLTVRDSVTPQIRNIDNNIKTLSSNIINGLGGAFAKVSGVIATTFAGVGAVSSVKEFASFEQGMKNVQAVSGATGEDLKKLTDKAREMGRTTAFTATDSAKAMEYMAMA